MYGSVFPIGTMTFSSSPAKSEKPRTKLPPVDTAPVMHPSSAQAPSLSMLLTRARADSSSTKERPLIVTSPAARSCGARVSALKRRSRFLRRWPRSRVRSPHVAKDLRVKVHGEVVGRDDQPFPSRHHATTTRVLHAQLRIGPDADDIPAVQPHAVQSSAPEPVAGTSPAESECDRQDQEGGEAAHPRQPRSGEDDGTDGQNKSDGQQPAAAPEEEQNGHQKIRDHSSRAEEKWTTARGRQESEHAYRRCKRGAKTSSRRRDSGSRPSLSTPWSNLRRPVTARRRTRAQLAKASKKLRASRSGIGRYRAPASWRGVEPGDGVAHAIGRGAHVH